MYRITLVLVAIMAASAYGGFIMPRQVLELDGRIVGGEDTTIERHPYQVSVRYSGYHMCGGSIVNSSAIVTAAHCTYGMNVNYFSVEYGSTVLGSSSSIIIGVKHIIVHPSYNPYTINNDVAVISLASDIIYSASSQPIVLAKESPAPGTVAVASGWGTTCEGGSPSMVLQQVGLETIDGAECKKQYAGANEITDGMLCAFGGKDGGKGACQGDSGGPLVANGQLVGIVSWGVGCARPEYAGVFSDVANLRSFIESAINKIVLIGILFIGNKYEIEY